MLLKFWITEADKYESTCKFSYLKIKIKLLEHYKMIHFKQKTKKHFPKLYLNMQLITNTPATYVLE